MTSTLSVTLLSPYSIDLLAKAFKKLTTNFTLATNLILLAARFQIPENFDSSNLDKLNNFFFQYQLYFYANSVQFTTDTTKINFAMIYLTRVV